MKPRHRLRSNWYIPIFWALTLHVSSADADKDTQADVLEVDWSALADEKLAPYKRPQSYRFLPELPRNAMGKIDRIRLAGHPAA